MSVHGLNALQIILASGFSGVTEVGDLPTVVVSLASLPEQVSLVRADEHVNFKLAAKRDDPVRSDTALLKWMVEATRTVISEPDYYLPGTRPRTFELLKRVTPHIRYPALQYLRLPIKFVPSIRATSGNAELWLSTIVVHTESTVRTYINRGVRLGA
jgi:hypothetical protein